MTTSAASSKNAVPGRARESLFERFLVPRTLEQTMGAVYILFAYTLTVRPFMAGLMNLQAAYGLSVLTVPVAGSIIALFGGILILLRRASRRQFALLFAPLPIYALALSLFCIQNPAVGTAGSFGFWCLTVTVAKMYSKRASQRERGVGEFAYFSEGET